MTSTTTHRAHPEEARPTNRRGHSFRGAPAQRSECPVHQREDADRLMTEWRAEKVRVDCLREKVAHTPMLNQAKRWDAHVRELVQVGYLLPPPVVRPEPTSAENEALRIECEAAELRAPLPEGYAGLIAAVQRWHDMWPRMLLAERGFKVTIDNEAEIVEPIAYEAE